MIRKIILQIQFLTRIPIPINVKFTNKDFASGIIYAPLVGLLIGGMLSLLYTGLSYLFYSPDGNISLLTAASLVFFEVIITGGLHVDGLADTFDGIFSNRSRERILEIMKDSRVGTNGVLAIVFLTLFKTALLFSVEKSIVVPLLLTMPVVSRFSIGLSASISPYARDEKGMAYYIVNNSGWKVGFISFICSLLIIIPLSIYFSFESIIFGFILVIIFIIFFNVYSKKITGGITGDVIGCVIELSEVIFILAVTIAHRSLPIILIYLM